MGRFATCCAVPSLRRILTMPVPIACPVTLAPEEHARLESLVRAHSTPQAFAFRCRLILRIAAPDRPSNLHVATGHVSLSRHPVESGRLGRSTRAASAAAPQSLQHLAHPGGGRPQAASECVLTQ